MIRTLFVCHGSILRSLEKACYINGFHRSDGAYCTTITPFAKELYVIHYLPDYQCSGILSPLSTLHRCRKNFL